jgi:chromosome segregation ATPase
MASFDPLSFFLVLLAISLECLGDIAVYLLDLPEWRMPREYTRSEYEPEEFCWYLVRWAMDGRDTAFVFGVFFSLLFSLVLLGPLGFWWHQRYRAGDERAEDLQTRSDKLETRRRDDQETITQLRGENNALQSQRSEFATRLDTQQPAISSIESVNATLQSQNIDLKNKLSGEQAARQRDAAEASEAAKKSNDWIKHQDEAVVAQRRKIEAQKQEIDALRQRAETAEQTLREKDNPIKTEEQQQQKIRLELANERIEKLEQEAEERKSEQEALQEDLDTAESKEHDLKNKLKAAASERQKVQTQLEKTQTELSEARQKFNKADNNASALQKKLTAADQLIKTKAADYKKLTDDNSVTKQRCTELEQENKALNAAKKQQQEFDPKLIIELNKRVERAERKVSDATERENKLKREHSSDQNRLKQQLKTATSQKQDLEKANRIAGLTNAKLTEKYDQATSGAKRAQKLQQEHQSDHQSKLKVQQEAVFKAQSETQKAQEDLKDCQQALKSTTHEQEKLVINQNSALEAKDKEHKEAVHSKDARIATLEVCMKEATERTSDHDEKMAQAQAELKNLQDDLELKSSTIRKLRFELECASVDIQEVNNVMYLLERKTWHEYLKRQEAWILESYTIVQNHLTQAESYIECLHVAFEVLQEEHQDALKAKDEAFATQKRQYEDTARKADEDLKACHEHGKVLKSKIQQLEGSLTDECKDAEAFEEQRDITELRLSAIHSAVESQRARMGRTHIKRVHGA